MSKPSKLDRRVLGDEAAERGAAVADRKVWDFCAAYRYTKPSGPIGSEGTTKCSHAFDVRGIYVHTACGQMAVAPMYTLPSELSAWGTGLPTCKACRKATGCD